VGRGLSGYIGTSIPGARNVNLDPLFDRARRVGQSMHDLTRTVLSAKRISGILRHYYQRAPYRCDILDLIPGIEETITGTGRLADVSEHATITLLRLLNWPAEIYRSRARSCRPAAAAT
jgi:hypothetical protein